MKLYKLPFVIHGPEEETENKFMAEIPALPGCRAWGNTAAEALENLQSVATAFIESYRDKGDSLPPGVEAAGQEVVGRRFLETSRSLVPDRSQCHNLGERPSPDGSPRPLNGRTQG